MVRPSVQWSLQLMEHLISHHIVDDTNILYSNKELKKINQYINYDLSLILQWLRANISLNQAKTEIIIFWSKGKIITKHLNFRICGLKINPINQTKYLNIYLDKHLSWNSHLNQFKTKLSRGFGLLAKLGIRYYVNTATLRSVYFAIFDAHLRMDHKSGVNRKLEL